MNMVTVEDGSKTVAVVGVVRNSSVNILIVASILHITGLVLIEAVTLTNYLDQFFSAPSSSNSMISIFSVLSGIDLLITLYLFLIGSRFREVSKTLIGIFVLYMTFSVIIRINASRVFVQIYKIDPQNPLALLISTIMATIFIVILPCILLLSSIAFLILNQEGYTKLWEKIMITLSILNAITAALSLFTLMTPMISSILYLLLRRFLLNQEQG